MIESVQVRQQLYIKQAQERLSPSFPATLVRMVREEGILSMYKGLTVSDIFSTFFPER